ncbi:MAG TPA: SpoIIE family protein phosphatase [Dongiaceae bacterium]|nr:SpoIIE family protein phosphatase [Dongiaceae bacterium]
MVADKTPVGADGAGSSQPPHQDPLDFAAALSRSFAATQDVEATIRQALTRIVELMHVEAGAIFLQDDTGEALVCRACVGPVNVEGLVVPKGQGIVGRSVAEDAVLVVEHAYENAAFYAEADRHTGFVTRSILCAPLTVGSSRIGAVEVLNKANGTIFDDSDQNMLKVIASSAGLAISNARLAARLVEQERLKRELELAAAIQRSLLPRADPDLPIAGFNRPIHEVSGDFYDFFQLPDGIIAFCLGDVSGKGMNAALLMAKTASLFRCLGKTVHDPARLITILNREICDTTSLGMFVTMVVGSYDPATGQLRFANAGHMPPLLKRADHSFETFPAKAPPLGILRDATFETEALSLDGRQFFLYTDGITEFRFGRDEELGVDGLSLMLDNVHGDSLIERVEHVLQELRQAGWQARDDLTLLAIDDALAAPAAGRNTGDGGEPAENGEFLVGFTLLADPSRLKILRPALQAAAMACGFSSEEVHDLVLAATEAVENIMIHAYAGRRDGEITLAMHRLPDGMMVRIRDFAPKVDTAKIQPRSLEEVRPGGLGTHFIRTVMDDATFIPLPDGEGNLLELVKYRASGNRGAKETTGSVSQKPTEGK